MAKRIIKETLHNGKEQYLVQRNSVPFIEALWTTDTVPMISDNGTEVYVDAVFNSLEEAQRFCGIKPDAERVIKREIIEYTDDKELKVKFINGYDQQYPSDFINDR